MNKVVAWAGLGALLGASISWAGPAPSIGGGASINVNTQGSIVNAGGGASGATVSAKQAVGSVLSGNISGKLSTSVSVKGAIVNAGGGASAGTKIQACQAIGTVGDNCGE